MAVGSRFQDFLRGIALRRDEHGAAPWPQGKHRVEAGRPRAATMAAAPEVIASSVPAGACHRAGQKAGPVGPTRVDETAALSVAPGLPRFARNDGESSAQTSPRHCEFGTGLRPTRLDETDCPTREPHGEEPRSCA